MPRKKRPKPSKFPRGVACHCLRCDARWLTRKDSDELPRACARCKSAFWNRPRLKRAHAAQGMGAEVE